MKHKVFALIKRSRWDEENEFCLFFFPLQTWQLTSVGVKLKMERTCEICGLACENVSSQKGRGSNEVTSVRVCVCVFGSAQMGKLLAKSKLFYQRNRHSLMGSSNGCKLNDAARRTVR